MTDTPPAAESKRENFLAAGLHELQRRYGRLTMRRKMRRQAAERTAALSGLGQRAWEDKLDLSSFPELRDRLTALEARVGEISQKTSALASGKASLEKERLAELEKFAARRQAVQDKKTPIDVSLGESRSRRIACERTISQGETPSAKLAASGELPGLIAEERRLAGDSEQCAAQIAAIDGEQKAALLRIDGELKRVQSDLAAASQQASATQKDRGETFAGLGAGLYDAGTSVPALAEHAARIAAIDRARADTEAALERSLAVTRAIAPGTMGKFWGAVAGVVVLVIAVASIANRSPKPPVEDRAGGESASVDETSPPSRPANTPQAKGDVVRRFAQAGATSGPQLRADAVRILKKDLETIGATADPAYLPILVPVLRSDDAELRKAAADAIGLIGPTDAERPALTRLLNDPEPPVAAAARRALGMQ